MYIVSYDITNDKRRRKVAKVMENYGRRVQYSVFECTLDKPKYNQMYQELCQLMDLEDTKEEGSIRIYSICKNCQQKTVLIGVRRDMGNEISENESNIIVIG